MDWNALLNEVVTWLSTEGVKLLIGVVVLFIVFKIINRLTRLMVKKAELKNRDKTLTKVLSRTLRIVLKVVAGVVFLGYVGIDTAGIGAAISSVGLAVGLALQGSLSNFAGGILILFLRPFKVDDYIECQGTSGTVEDIRIFYTHLRTPDNKVVLIPNGSLIGGNVINYSTKATRRVDLVFAIDYEADYKQAKAIILDVCAKHQLILEDPAPAVRIAEWAASSINLSCKVWVKNANYWDVTFDLLETVYDEMNKAGIKIPYNQLEISYRDALKQQEKENK